MKIELPISKKVSFLLTPEQGNIIRDLIIQQIDVSFRYYVSEVLNMHASNVSSILSGKRVTSIENLEKLISGTNLEITECLVKFTMENVYGDNVRPADLLTTEEMLSSAEEIGSDHLSPQCSNTPSSLSEKPQGKLRTLLATRSWENPEENSEKSSGESNTQPPSS